MRLISEYKMFLINLVPRSAAWLLYNLNKYGNLSFSVQKKCRKTPCSGLALTFLFWNEKTYIALEIVSDKQNFFRAPDKTE